ncbi:response regulator transcription factor [Modestobacter sp. L9-4]|uniref:response regulator transcription factor n=1 Tax=Modestobacter sp. L9-4 TaxID=2851567 RepID=UPI001C7857C0|nr:response regulator transcription factor [Modestobacter sp. L9-4]QXG75161.1 response regulator transcription factor [Modestobacter sp. L9-4]
MTGPVADGARSRRVLVVDDDRLVRRGLVSILDSDPGLTVVGEAADGAEALTQVRALSPDVVVMDLRMPRVDGIEATRRLSRLDHPPAVLVLTTFDADEHVYAALRAGAGGFVLKDAPEAHLLAAVRAVGSGTSLLDPRVTLRLVEQLAPAPTGVPTGALQHLTPRELDVLREVARGASNEEVADALQIGEATVKTHVSRVLAKLGVLTRVQAVVLAYEHGLVVPGSGGPAVGRPWG